jgi:NAD+ synthase
VRVSTSVARLSSDVLAIDGAAVAARIESAIREQVFGRLRRRGVVVGLSGGIDSSVVAALCARALGCDRVLGLFMPEADSSWDSLRLGRLLASHLGVHTELEDIGPVLTAAGCYARRDAAIRLVVPEYGDGDKSKLAVTNGGDASYAFYSVVVQSPDGRQITRRLTPEACLGIVAATNLKQRTRKMIEYYHADRCRYAVAGTPNRLEYDQGFFVKGGDGAADLKPIAHLYKSQVYDLARHLGLPDEILRRPPTTDTYSLEQSQEEFYFAIPLAQMDLCLFARDHEMPADELAAALDWPVARASRMYAQIDARRRSACYLHMAPLVVEPIELAGC